MHPAWSTTTNIYSPKTVPQVHHSSDLLHALAYDAATPGKFRPMASLLCVTHFQLSPLAVEQSLQFKVMQVRQTAVLNAPVPFITMYNGTFTHVFNMSRLRCRWHQKYKHNKGRKIMCSSCITPQVTPSHRFNSSQWDSTELRCNHSHTTVIITLDKPNIPATCNLYTPSKTRLSWVCFSCPPQHHLFPLTVNPINFS